MADGLADIQERWSVTDLLEMHRALTARAAIKAALAERAAEATKGKK